VIDHRALSALRFWLDSWSGIGVIAAGMARQARALQLTRYDERGWRATFYTSGIERSRGIATTTTRTSYERTPGETWPSRPLRWSPASCPATVIIVWVSSP